MSKGGCFLGMHFHMVQSVSSAHLADWQVGAEELAGQVLGLTGLKAGKDAE